MWLGYIKGGICFMGVERGRNGRSRRFFLWYILIDRVFIKDFEREDRVRFIRGNVYG